MSNARLLPVQTASANQSIWRGTKLDTFRRHVVDLQYASNKVPSDPEDHSARLWLAQRTNAVNSFHLLPFHVEQRVADDLAFIAAAEEGVKSVSAVALEQHVGAAGLTIRLAANETIPKNVPSIFRRMFDLMSQCATDRKVSRETCAENLFDQVIMLSQNRIHGRLQSAFWQPPNHRKREARRPLYSNLREVSLRIERLPSRNGKKSRTLLQKLNDLCELFQRLDTYSGASSELLASLKDIVKQCYAVSTSDGTYTFEETVTSYGYEPKAVCKNKYIEQVYKLGRYWGLCVYLAAASKKYWDIFQSMDLATIRPYRSIISPISFKGGSVECHVHAEIQLLIYYDSNPNVSIPKPRVLGVSKAACYLCNLFSKKHAEFFLSQTHGQLYDQWNVPDLADFANAQRLKYRSVLKSMDTELQIAIKRERARHRSQKRQEPLGSRLNLATAFPLSPLASDAGTVRSEVEKAPQHSSPSRLTPPVEDPSIALASRTNAPQSQSQAAATSQFYNHHYNLRSISQIPPTPFPPQYHSTPAVNQRRTTVPDAPEASNHRGKAPELVTNRSTLDEPISSLDQPQAPATPPSILPKPSSPSPLLGLRTHHAVNPSLVSTISSWELPTSQHLTPITPLHLLAGNLSLTIEIEEPARGTVAITQTDMDGISNRDEGAVVDVGEMEPGEERELECPGKGGELKLGLRYGGAGVDVLLGWN